jgi:DNA-binding CsgD family transcriptional regulator
MGVGARPDLCASRDDTDGRVSDAVSVSWTRENRQHQASVQAGSIRPAGEPARAVVLAPQTASGSCDRRWSAPSHSRSRSTLAGSAYAGARSRISSSLSSGVPRPASLQTDVEPAAEHLPLSESLSPAETRVLRYLPSLLSLREIGDEVYLSVNTIKVHVRHIYAKLEVHSRRGAVERARSLGLL